MMDYQSLKLSDSHPCDLWRNEFEERGQTMTFCHDDGQRWCFLGGHQSNEVTMIKIWDSKEDVSGKCELDSLYLTSHDGEKVAN